MQQMDVRPFYPVDPTVSLAVGAASSQVALTVPTNQGNAEIPSTIRVVNSGTVLVFVEFGTSSAVAATTASGMPVLPGSERTFLLPRGITNAAAIGAAAGPTNVYFTSGHGS